MPPGLESTTPQIGCVQRSGRTHVRRCADRVIDCKPLAQTKRSGFGVGRKCGVGAVVVVV
eukprot:1185395-Prorocentrum_minimum.AAC.5